ncbi:MAG: hypothetical protein EBT15_12660 [Betaproteobacteria bacterium]|nr:hypothetical protein [Betaproteobacteria bacterium]
MQPSANVPFIEYDPATGSALGWRIWDAVTNLVRQSGAISLSLPWQATGTAPSVTTNAIAAPDNSMTATRVTFAAADSRIIQGLGFNPARNTTYTASVFARPVTTGTLNKVRIAVYDGASQINSDDFTLSPGWQRISFTFTTSATAPTLDPTFQVRNQFSASVANDVYLWGAQLNTGLLAPYVPTGALTASSTADVASITGAAFSGIYNASALTVYAEVARGYSGNFQSYPNIYQFSDGTSSNTIPMYGVLGNSQITNYDIKSGGVAQNDYVQRSHSTPAPFKAVQALAANDSIFGTDGVLTTQDTTITMPVGINQMRIGSSFSVGSQWNGYIRELAIFKSRRPNANLQSMTQ